MVFNIADDIFVIGETYEELKDNVNKTLYRARQSVFWPGLTKDINEIILACPASMKYVVKKTVPNL